jgi:hypothetical protein
LLTIHKYSWNSNVGIVSHLIQQQKTISIKLGKFDLKMGY